MGETVTAKFEVLSSTSAWSTGEKRRNLSQDSWSLVRDLKREIFLLV